MTWTYTGDPAANTRDEVRFLVGDTDKDDALVQDEEINYAIGVESSTLRAAVRVSRAIAAHYARAVEKQVGDLKIKAGEKYKNYLDIMKALEEEAAGSIPGASPFAGGISTSQKETQENNSDRVAPYFSRDMMDNPNSGSSAEEERTRDDC